LGFTLYSWLLTMKNPAKPPGRRRRELLLPHCEDRIIPRLSDFVRFNAKSRIGADLKLLAVSR
jgi:hypothetical protein